VAVVTTLIITLVVVVFAVVFDAIDANRLLAQVDGRLNERMEELALQKNELSLPGSRLPGSSTSSSQVTSSSAQIPSRPSTALQPAGLARDNDTDVDSAPVLAWFVDPHGQVTALSDGAPQIAKGNWSSGRAVTERAAGITLRLLPRHMGGNWLVVGQSLSDTSHVEHVLLTGELVAGPVLLIATFLVTFVIGVQAARPVEMARRRQLDFTADASHELRTPLSVIEAELSLALGADRKTVEYREALGRIRSESGRLRRMVDDLLWLARFDSEPPAPRHEPVDVEAIAHACSERFNAVASSKGVEISVERRGEELAWIDAPPELVDRLCGVLLDNACRYAREGGKVVVRVSASASRVGLAVEDDGPGIPDAERERLFDRFHRSTDEHGGAGLGLAIADSVARSTGGRWHVGGSDLGGASMQVSWHRAAPRGRRSPGNLDESTRA
jgi:signal transduction histidine kinase